MNQVDVAQVWLRPVPVGEALTLLAGGRPDPAGVRLHPQYPSTDTLDALAMLLGAHEAMQPGAHEVMQPGAHEVRRPGGPRWWIHQIVVGDTVVGDIGFHGPPFPERPWAVEIGYQVVPGWRCCGVATRACGLILARAWADGADRVLAQTDRDNTASRRVLAAHGFRVRLDGVHVLDRRSAVPSAATGPR